MSEQRKQLAQETLKIQNQGYYTSPSGKHIDIGALQKHSESAAHLIAPVQGEELVKTLPSFDGLPNTLYRVVNESTVKTIIETAKTDDHVVALNFASAKNPGGGFLNGSMAQEEALAYSSGLYNTQIRHMVYYESNRATKSMMYTDHAIYSPNVPFFRDENLNLIEAPVTCSILTLPAVNMRQVKEKGENTTKAKQVMKNRMSLALAVFAHENNNIIILGAYGCGVFGNDPNDIARYWKELLVGEKYGRFFRQVIFTVLDKSGGENISVFKREFDG